MNYKIVGMSVSKKEVEGKLYCNYYLHCEYQLNQQKGIGNGVKQYVCPLATIEQCIKQFPNQIKKDSDLIGKVCEFYMNEQYKNSTFQNVGLIIVH